MNDNFGVLVAGTVLGALLTAVNKRQPVRLNETDDAASDFQIEELDAIKQTEQ